MTGSLAALLAQARLCAIVLMLLDRNPEDAARRLAWFAEIERRAAQ